MENEVFKSSSVKAALLIATATFTALSASTIASKAEGYLANYDAYVISVQPWDALFVRAWPAYYSQKVGEIPHNGQYIWVQRCIVQPNGSSSDWCKVNFEGQWGWVNKRFLAQHH